MTLPRAYFDDLYRGDDDPWRFRSRPYEARKRALTLASLPDARYTEAFEPGCSIGILTAALAERCDRVVAMDISPLALRTAAASVPANVQLVSGAIPEDWPDQQFDLVVLSEMGYYVDRRTCQQLADRAIAGTRDLVAVHWRHRVADYPLTGDEVHAVLSSATRQAGMVRLVHHMEADFVLAVWSHDRRSVAVRTGLIDT